MTINRDELAQYLNSQLDPTMMADYCPNGLQLEGKPQIAKILTGVTASQALLDEAVNRQVDAVLVHHGLMWKGDPQVVTGFRRTRLKTALQADLNVFAYHLPLDKHPVWGNNVQLGGLLGWHTQKVLGTKGLVHWSELGEVQTVGEIQRHVSKVLGSTVQLVGQTQLDRPIRRVAWCTGGAPSYVEDAALAGADLYLTGELSEPAVHVAQEMGVTLVGAGHHATERCGVQALGQHLSAHFGLEVEFVDLYVPV